MRYVERAPGPPLDRHVRCVWTLAGRAAAASAPPEPVIPDGCAEIVLNVGDPFIEVRDGTGREQPRAMVVGQTSGPTLLRPGVATRMVGIRLHPWGGPALLGVPMGDLTDRFLPLDAIAPGLGELHERLAALPEPEWIPATFRHLRRVVTAEPAGGLARPIVSWIRERDGRLTVRELADRLGASRRTVERVMRRDVGLSPTVFARILRVQAAIRRLRASERPVLGRIALEAGYYDQPHFCREFRRLTTLSPSEFLARERGITEAFLESEAV